MKDVFRSLWSAALSLLLALLKRRRSSGAWVVCHFDQALRFIANNLLISGGKWLFGLDERHGGVAALADCCKMAMKLVVATSISSLVFSFIGVVVCLHTSVLYRSQFVCEV